MKVLDKKLLRDLSRSRGMLSAIVAIIAVGAACFSGMLGTFFSLEDAATTYYSRCRMADFWIDLKRAPISETSRLVDISGVAETRSRLVFPVVVDLEEIDKPLSGILVSMPETPEPVINGFVLRRGGYFTTGQDNEVIISEKFAAARNITPGSFIHLVMNGRKEKLLVVGTAISSEFTYLIPPGGMTPDNEDYGVFWAKHRYMADRFGFHGACNNVVGLLTPEARHLPGQTKDKIKRRLERFGLFGETLLSEQYSNLSLRSEMDGLKVLATVLPLIFMGVAAMILNVVMLRMAEQQRTVIGTLKALGISDHAIQSHFLKFGIIVGLAGGTVGCVFGYVISLGMINMYQQFFSFPRLESQVYPGIMLTSMVISILFAAGGSRRGARAVIAMSPAEAMRPSPPMITGKIFLERWNAFWRHLDFRSQILFRNIFRNPGRSIVGISAAMFGGAILFVAMGMYNSFKYMLAFEYNNVLRSDYIISLRHETSCSAVFEAARLPGITLAEARLEVPCHLIHDNRNKKLSLTGIAPDSRLTIPRNLCGEPTRMPETGILINRRLASELNAKPGDYLKMIPIKGKKTPRYPVVAGIIESTIGLVAYADFAYLNRLVGQTSALTSLQLRGRPNQDEKRALFRQVKRYPNLAIFSAVSRMKKKMSEEFIQSMASMTVMLIIFSGIIFFGSILNAALISISERQREIATFRVLGYRSSEIGQIFFRESLIINMMGALCGLPLGYLMLYGITKLYQNDMFSMPCVAYPSTWLLTPVLAWCFIVCAYAIISRVIRKMNWSDALKMRE